MTGGGAALHGATITQAFASLKSQKSTAAEPSLSVAIVQTAVVWPSDSVSLHQTTAVRPSASLSHAQTSALQASTTEIAQTTAI